MTFIEYFNKKLIFRTTIYITIVAFFMLEILFFFIIIIPRKYPL